MDLTQIRDYSEITRENSCEHLEEFWFRNISDLSEAKRCGESSAHSGESQIQYRLSLRIYKRH